MGFPYGLATEAGQMNDGFPIPFVKKGILSAMTLEDHIIFLDGHNNPGFSGGPVVYQTPGDTRNEMRVGGVISGYIGAPEPVYDAQGKPILNYQANTGIVKAYSISCATDLIHANPIGFGLNSR